MMELVRYRPGDAIRWLDTGADSSRKNARDKAGAIVRQGVPRRKEIGASVKNAAGAIWQLGRGAYTDLMRKRATAHEYVLEDECFTVVKGSGSQSVSYNSVKRMRLDRDKVTLTTADSEISIKPYAFILAGRIKVPIGWERNGMEVPYELLIEELAARCRLEVEED